MRRIGLACGTWLFVGFGALSASDQAAESPARAQAKTPAEQFEAMVKEHTESQQAFIKAARKAKTAEDRAKLVRPSPEKYRKQILDLALQNPKEPFAVDALIWLVQNGGSEQALDILATSHLQDKRLGRIARNLGEAPSPTGEKMLRAVLANEASDHEARGQACLALARTLKHQADESGSPTNKECEKYFALASENYADVTFFGRQKIGDVAKGALFEIRNLGIGKTAPDIEAKDLNGNVFKLSDYRGKVVLLDFWGNW